jgi:hypothetical protein
LSAGAALYAALAFTQLLAQVGNDFRLPSALLEVQSVGTDLFRADPYATKAEYAAVVVHHYVFIRRIDVELGVQIRETDRIHTVLYRQLLEFAVAAL